MEKPSVRHYEKPIDLARLTSLVTKQTAEIAGPIMMAVGEEIDFDGYKIKYKGNESVAEVIREIYLSVRVTTNTIIKIGEIGGNANISSLPIVRGVVEGCINATYIMSAGEGAAKDALSHAIAKAYHNTDRTAGIDSHAINVKRSPPVTLTDELQAIVAKFTSKKGRPLNWTSLSVSQRIAIIAKSFNKNIATQLNASYLMIYSDASEIIHGSYLGSLMTHGRDPLSTFSLHGRSFKDVHDHHHESSLLAAFLSIHSTLDAFCQYSNVAGDPFELKDNFAEFSKIILTK